LLIIVNATPKHARPEAKVSNPTAGLSCFRLVFYSGEILTTGNSHKKQSDGLTQEDSEMKNLL
jgi:alkylated DNA nucleotide flippase Atl1